MNDELILFSEIVGRLPTTKDCLDPKTRILENEIFESVIAKVQGEQESDITIQETRYISVLNLT